MIDYLNLKKVNSRYEDLHVAIDDILRSGWYLQGAATQLFEHDYAAFTGFEHCVGVANGLDALTLILRCYMEMGLLSEGDEVIVPANTYIASILAITENHLTPILVEPRFDTLQIDDSLIAEAITPRTRAIMTVNLYGRNAYTPLIGQICRNNGLILVVDNAQAHGIEHAAGGEEWLTCPKYPWRPMEKDVRVAVAHSFYPSKNMGALGDAGAVTTDDEELAQLVRSVGNYGSSRKYVFPYRGRNSRIDELQAAVLSVILPHLLADNARRTAIADRYLGEVKNDKILLPTRHEAGNVWHIFPVFSPDRDRLQAYLAEKGVETAIHYPIPPHKQACYKAWNDLSFPITERIHREELSLPIGPYLDEEEVDTIIKCLNDFC